MKAIYVISTLLVTGLLLFLASLYFSTDTINAFLTNVSWMEFFSSSILIAFAFDKQKVIIMWLVFFASLIILGGSYLILERVFRLNMLYVNCLILFLFINFVILLFSGASSPLPQKANPSPKNPLPLLVSGRITSKEQLKQFYDDQKLENVTFENYVRATLSLARESLDDNQWGIARDLLQPIVNEFEDQQPFSLINGQEKESLQQIYLLVNQTGFRNKESIVYHLKRLADEIFQKNQRFEIEEKKNSQALTLSIIGLIITIILSSVSICISLFGWSIR